VDEGQGEAALHSSTTVMSKVSMHAAQEGSQGKGKAVEPDRYKPQLLQRKCSIIEDSR